MSLPLLFLLLAFAAGRITRLIVIDDFPPIFVARKKIALARPVIEKRPLRGETYTDFWWLGELITCAWCASGWVSLGLWLATWWFVPLPLPLLWWPAVWGAGAILAAKLG
jgi:hypothetical protein